MRYLLFIKLIVLSITCVFTQEYNTLYVEVPEPSPEALSYYKSGNVLWVINLIWGFIVPLLFLLTGFSARIRNWAKKLSRNKWFFTIVFYVIIFSIISHLIDFPLSYYKSFIREHAYNLSNQTFLKWFTDSMNSLLIGIIMGSLILWIPYLLLRKSPKRWWLFTSVFMMPIMVVMMIVYPIWISPIFNDFGPMKDKTLEAKILAIAEESGIEGSRVYEVNKSIDTKKLNAYVTGFGDTKRIVLWDTIIAKLNERELLTVMAHEMAHYVLGHTINRFILSFFVLLLTLYGVYRTADIFINRFKNRLGFDKFSDIASFPLLLVLISLFSTLTTPFVLGLSRYQETEADRFSLELTQNNNALASSFVKLQEENLAVPRPGWLYKFWRSSHPSLGDRIDFCNNYRPWEERKPLKYEVFFSKRIIQNK
jgi:Zn-dependent protease with chaperone function